MKMVSFVKIFQIAIVFGVVQVVVSYYFEGLKGGALYTRWGSKTCPSSAELVYSGYAGGSYYYHHGGAAEFLCMPRDPQWGFYVDGNDGSSAYVYGTEYETKGLKDSRKNLQDHDVPCAVCLSHRHSVVMMIPGRRDCYRGWKVEYSGYLMAGLHSNASPTEYVCVDKNPEALHGGRLKRYGAQLYKVEAQCGSLQCPPYVNGRELTCVVCTR